MRETAWNSARVSGLVDYPWTQISTCNKNRRAIKFYPTYCISLMQKCVSNILYHWLRWWGFAWRSRSLNQYGFALSVLVCIVLICIGKIVENHRRFTMCNSDLKTYLVILVIFMCYPLVATMIHYSVKCRSFSHWYFYVSAINQGTAAHDQK